MFQFTQMLGKFIGITSGGAATIMWIQLMWFGGFEWSQPFPVFFVAMAMVIISIAVIIASLHGHSRALLFLFVISFFPIGISIFTAEHWIRWVAVVNIGYLLAALLLWRSDQTKQ